MNSAEDGDTLGKEIEEIRRAVQARLVRMLESAGNIMNKGILYGKFLGGPCLLPSNFIIHSQNMNSSSNA
jgi:hypothetical protein